MRWRAGLVLSSLVLAGFGLGTADADEPPPVRYLAHPPSTTPAAPTPTPPPAKPPPAARPAGPRFKPRPQPKEPPPPTGPTPNVSLTLVTPTPKDTWSMRVTNEGTIPVRLVADARLLVLEVTPRGAAKSLRCELPADMRPDDDSQRPLVLPPGRSYVEKFEPRLYCFGNRLMDALAQGTIVVAHLGWTGGSKARPPFVVGPIAGVEPEVAPLKELVSLPIGLPDEPSAELMAAAPAAPTDPDPTKLVLRTSGAIEAPSPAGISVTVSLRNDGKRAVVTRFRPETLRFNVVGPGGVVDCRWLLNPVAAMPDLFTTIPPGKTIEQAVLLDAYCTDRVFHHPGLLVVRAELDTRAASGEGIGLKTFDGHLVSRPVTVVRLHQGLKPPVLQHPRLEPLPGELAAMPVAPPPPPLAAPPPRFRMPPSPRH